MIDFFDKENLNICVTCASGVESVTKRELYRLGFGNVPAVNGVLSFNGNACDIAKCNLNLRTADRVYVKVAEFKAETFDQLFDGVFSVDWQKIISADGAIVVDGKCVKSKIFAISASQSIVKKAICKKLGNGKPLFESGAVYRVYFSIFKDKAEIFLNTSGVGLHKRGYRDMVGVAPIKETLASAMLLMSDFYRERPLRDTFCGSGTIIIEGAMIALNIAPGKDREFDFLKWKGFDKKAYTLAKEECLDKELKNVKLDFSGSDIDKKAIKIAKRHALNAGVHDFVNFIEGDVKNFKPTLACGTIVTNPPYGERVYDREDAEECYRNLGLSLKGFEGWSLFVITSHKNFEKFFGRKSDRNRKLFNSEKECRFYYYYGKKEQ